MPITSLRITDFRNLASVSLEPAAIGLNVIYGLNGSGKTSLLESIYYLGHGRSFRSAQGGRLIRHTTDAFSIFAQAVSPTLTEASSRTDTLSTRLQSVGVSRDLSGGQRLRIDQQVAASIADLALLLPIRVINSQSHHLFESGPQFRRKFLDWGLFHQSDHFLPCWRLFERALKQRNAVLRDKRPKKELDVWTEALVKHGLELTTFRRQYVLLLSPLLSTFAHQLLGISDLHIHYQPGWREDMEYLSVLTNHQADEYRLGCTQYGPHRADMDLTVEGVSVRHFLSRGQQKLLICAMILSQGMLLAREANKGLIYLIDDLPSELDLHSKHKLISLLSKQETQIFITAIEDGAIGEMRNEQFNTLPLKVFHVEQGNVNAQK